MNNDIRNALLDLFSVCLEVNGAGRFHAHMSYSGHINGVHVYVAPAETDYGDHSYTYTMEGLAYLDDELGGTPAEVLASLKALSDRVSELLLPAQGEAA